jgi:hypothetical protein
MRRTRLSFYALTVTCLFLAAPASAQTRDDGPDPGSIRVRFGPLWMNPTIALPNLGVDTNVFNEPSNASPKSDTMTVAPKADLWLRMGRTWLSGTIAEDVVWYQQYESERSTNHLLGVAWKAPFNRLVTSVGASWVSTLARPGFEIVDPAAFFKGVAKVGSPLGGGDRRLGFNIDRERRTSAPGREYHGLKSGTSLTCGS